MVPSPVHSFPRVPVRVPDDLTFRTFIESVRDYALLVLDHAGNVISWNAGAQAIKGYRADEIIGRHFSVFYPPESIARGLPAQELAAAARDGQFKEEGWRVRKDGSRFFANVLITAIRHVNGELSGFSSITRDLTERLRHEAALRHSEERFRVLVENVEDYAIGTLDGEGRVTSWNHGAERITGYQSEEILGQSFSRLYPPEDIRANKAGRQLEAARLRGRVNEESWRMRRDGSQYWANNVLAMLPQCEGQQQRFYLVTQDLTQRRYTENLADTTHRTHEFIAMLAHELRNPLAPIRNAVAIMARRGLDDPLMDAMRLTIDRQSQNLARIVNELLDVNRVARGQLTIEKQTVDLRDVVARAIETSRPTIESRRHILHLDIADGPIECSADPMRLAQVVVNILDNAARYTADGGHIWLCVERQAHMVELRIRDSGRGIERDNLDRVFDLFIQVEPGEDAAIGGLGVGLALARRVVELHGGYVQALSEGPGKGSEFVLRLPIGTRARLPEPVVPITPGSAEFVPLRILVVDDNVDAADSLCLLMRAMGHETRAVYDGPAAIVAAEDFTPDVVMLDIGMPTMSGYQVARALRDARNTATIVALTGWGDEVARRQAREAGFDHHVMKPVTEADLIDLLAMLAAQRLAR